MQRVGVSVLRQRARVLVENEREQFPVASAVPVAPQWGEQRGKTTATTIGKHNGKKNQEKQQRKMKSEKNKKNSFFILFNCFKIMPVHKSKEKKRKSQIFFEIFFWRWAQVLSHQFSQRLARGLRPNNGVVQRGNTTGTTIGKHNGGNKTGNSREKWKKMYAFFMDLLTCF